jgi:hypothetical protein
MMPLLTTRGINDLVHLATLGGYEAEIRERFAAFPPVLRDHALERLRSYAGADAPAEARARVAKTLADLAGNPT